MGFHRTYFSLLFLWLCFFLQTGTVQANPISDIPTLISRLARNFPNSRLRTSLSEAGIAMTTFRSFSAEERDRIIALLNNHDEALGFLLSRQGSAGEITGLYPSAEFRAAGKGLQSMWSAGEMSPEFFGLVLQRTYGSEALDPVMTLTSQRLSQEVRDEAIDAFHRLLGNIFFSSTLLMQTGNRGVSMEAFVSDFMEFVSHSSVESMERALNYASNTPATGASVGVVRALVQEDFIRGYSFYGNLPNAFIPFIGADPFLNRAYFYLLGLEDYASHLLRGSLVDPMNRRIYQLTQSHGEELLDAIRPRTNIRLIVNWASAVHAQGSLDEALDLMNAIFRRMQDLADPDQWRAIRQDLWSFSQDNPQHQNLIFPTIMEL